jgi:hypothetical protein
MEEDVYTGRKHPLEDDPYMYASKPEHAGMVGYFYSMMLAIRCCHVITKKQMIKAHPEVNIIIAILFYLVR